MTIRSGVAAGLSWRRYHRFVNAYWLGNYELDVQLALRRLLREGDVFYDVGANAGFFTVLAGRLVGPRGKVLAFEPVPESAEAVREQIALNGLSWCQVILLAVGARSEKRTLSYEPASPSQGRLGPKQVPNEVEIAVETMALDHFVVDHPFPDVVKVDVEGGEVDVLVGASSIVERGACFVLELHGSETTGGASKVLRDAGYAVESLAVASMIQPVSHGRWLARPRQSRANGEGRGAKVGVMSPERG